MQPTTKKRIYPPRFSELAIVSVRRFAWALGKSMPATLDRMVCLLPSIVDPSKVCLACKDTTKCQNCVFKTSLTKQDMVSLLRTKDDSYLVQASVLDAR